VLHLKLTIAYDGTGLVGWQRQANGISVQGLLEEALAPLQLAPVSAAGAGRTDAGVHALGQVASVTLQRQIAPESVVRATNLRLPPAVRVLNAEVVGPEFHARFRAVAKTYRYRIWNSETLNPFERAYVWHVPVPRLDVEAMAAAAERLVGVHDFAALQGTGGHVETSVRTISSSVVTAGGSATPDSLITYDVRGDGFLRHMVRTIAGTLVEVGRGRRPVSWIDDVIASRDRGRAGRTAPAAGLFLASVEYE
jgi:tRNA pseudouridine38-40 synthase